MWCKAQVQEFDLATVSITDVALLLEGDKPVEDKWALTLQLVPDPALVPVKEQQEQEGAAGGSSSLKGDSAFTRRLKSHLCAARR